MLKRILAILLSLLLLPSLAAAAEIDLSDYSQEELESILQKASLQLLINYTKSEAGLLYDDENFSVYYSFFDKIGDDDYAYLDVIVSNKTDKSYSYVFQHVSLNYFPYAPERKPISVLPQSSSLISIPIPHEEYERNPIRSLENVAICFLSWSAGAYDSRDGISTDTYSLQ